MGQIDIVKKIMKEEIIKTINEESVNESQKRQATDVAVKFDKAYLNFSREIRDIIKMVVRITGNRTDGKIFDKAYRKQLIPFDALFKSWYKGQQDNPHIKESVNEDSSTIKVKKQLLKKFGKDPLYKDVIMAKNSKEMKKAMVTLKSIRGGNALILMQKYAKKLVGIKESVNEAKPQSYKFKFKCMECGKSFLKSLKKSLEVKCPKCTSVDIELENINEGFTKYHIRLTDTSGWYGVWDKKGKQKFEGDRKYVTKHLKKLKTKMGNFQIKSLVDLATDRKGTDITFDVVESVVEDLDPYKDFGTKNSWEKEYDLNLGAFVDSYQTFMKGIKSLKPIKDKHKRAWAHAIRKDVGQGMFNGYIHMWKKPLEVLKKYKKYEKLPDKAGWVHESLNEAIYFDEERMIKLINKDKFLKYTVKSKYRGKPKTKDLESMFNTFIRGDSSMEKLYRKI